MIAIANSQNSSRNSLIEDVFNFSKKSAESLSLQTTLEGTGMIMGGVLGGALSIGALKMNSDMCSKIQDKNTQITNIKIASAPTQPVDALPDAARVVAATDAAPASDPATAGAGQGAAPGPISETIKLEEKPERIKDIERKFEVTLKDLSNKTNTINNSSQPVSSLAQGGFKAGAAPQQTKGNIQKATGDAIATALSRQDSMFKANEGSQTTFGQEANALAQAQVASSKV